MQDTYLIFQKDNKYTYESRNQASSLIYKDGTYYPATFTQWSNVTYLNNFTANTETNIFSHEFNCYVSDIVTYHYLSSIALKAGNSITLKCYADDQLCKTVLVHKGTLDYAYPTTTFNINKYVGIYRETLTFTTTSQIFGKDKMNIYAWTIQNTIL